MEREDAIQKAEESITHFRELLLICSEDEKDDVQMSLDFWEAELERMLGRGI